jgi:8-oxo-dGTP pyrophosphatase MutT (NUDIX family)
LVEINQKLKVAISSRTKLYLHEPSRKPSAVLVPIYYQQGEHFILFTKRTELVHHHKGEISFPGGGYHPDDGNLLRTALRESFEEIGLDPSEVEVLGELDDIFTKGSPYVITPFVGSIHPHYEYKVSNFEIAEIIRISVRSLLEEGCRREEPEIVLSGVSQVPYVYTFHDKIITGATARILKQFLDIFVSVTSSR